MKPKKKSYKAFYWSCYDPSHRHTLERAAEDCISSHERVLANKESDQMRKRHRIKGLLMWVNKTPLREIKEKFGLSRQQIQKAITDVEFTLAIEHLDSWGQVGLLKRLGVSRCRELYSDACRWILSNKEFVIPTWKDLGNEKLARMRIRVHGKH